MSLSRTARRISLPALLAVVLAAALIAIGAGRPTPAGASADAAAAGGGHSAKPVIVLEHGAWADASSWSNVISRLQRRGFTVFAGADRQSPAAGHAAGWPLTASAFTEPSRPPAWKTIPSWAVIGTGDRVIPPPELTFMARRAGARITDVNAGHLSLISRPSVVTRVILQAVKATG